jgi:hypothetical protein
MDTLQYVKLVLLKTSHQKLAPLSLFDSIVGNLLIWVCISVQAVVVSQ